MIYVFILVKFNKSTKKSKLPLSNLAKIVETGA